MENKKVKLILSILFILIVISVITLIGIYNEEIAQKAKEIQEVITQTGYKNTDNINIVPTMQDEISDNSVWCCTFQLIWNDLKNEVAKTDIVFEEPNIQANNLNKEEFNVTMISDDYYYKKHGMMNTALKKEIETEIDEKFKEKSSVLNDFEWKDEETDKYFLYAMLKRQFEFYYEFDNLDKGQFGEEYKNVSYFGIDEDTKEEVRNQVEVLYYNSKDDFAIQLSTKQNDEVIICKGNEGTNFKEIYDKVQNLSAIYVGSKKMKSLEYLKIPDISFKEKKEFVNLENKVFKSSIGETYMIDKALQTIDFKLDKKGGSIKSEAGMSTMGSDVIREAETREFSVDNTFTLFLQENGKNMPYFAAKIKDITKFQ